MTDFSRLDRADDWLARVGHVIRVRVMSAGVGNWNYSPGYAQARQRAARVLARAADRRDREVRALHSAAVPPGVTRARLHRRSDDRIGAALAHGQASPGRASR
jgi:hypothetical protein